MKNSFKIIAIKPLAKCYKKHLKVLRNNTIYYFYQDYDIKHLRVKNETITIKENYPTDLFNKKNLNINISAVVGKNGSGKSTIVELLFKAINNIAFNFKQDDNDKNKTIISDIEEVKGIHLDFYIEKDKRIFKINILNTDFKVYEFTGNENHKTLNTIEIEKFKLTDLFYTEVINYSHYAYNNRIEGDWIQKLFHKNDSYQTPVVFSPMRTSGNTDINKENELVKQRLITNLLNPSKSDKEFDFRKIGDNLIANEIILKLKSEKIKILYNIKLNEWFNINDYIKPKERKAILHIAYQIFFEIEDFGLKELNIENNIYRRIESYVVYKLISITYKYSEYEVFFNQKTRRFNDDISDERDNNLENYLMTLKNDNSHITFKLKKTLNYLHYNHIPFNKNIPIELDVLSENISNIRNTNLKEKIIDLIPPPIFSLEILLKNKNNDSINFSLLSSGEKQFVYSISSILYHLKNLDSVSDNKTQYKNINIVFEEIELYFHPNLQRKFIDELLKSIDRLQLENITSLNIIFVTHSPFILSDIPSNNVMFLNVEKGKSLQELEKKKTFGANIHELLMSNFFFDESVFIGEFSKNKIEEIIKELNSVNEKSKLTQERKEYINKFISTIDEKIIRTKLREMLYEVSANDKDDYNWIDKEIEYLTNLRK